jgi:hypothetical protein
VRTHVLGRGFVFAGSFGAAGWFSGAVVAALRVDGQRADEFAGGGVDDADVEVVDEEQDVGSGMRSPDADVVELAIEPHRDLAGGIDAVASDAGVGVVAAGAALGRVV